MDTSHYSNSSQHQMNNHRNTFQNWEKRSPWEEGKNREEKRKESAYPIWSSLQVIVNRLEQLYSEGTDFATTSPATFTDADFRMLPFRLVWPYSAVAMIFHLMWLFAFLAPMLQIFQRIEGIFAYVTVLLVLGGIGIIFPAVVVYSARQWVSGKERTGRYYKHLARGWAGVTGSMYLSTVLFLLLPYGYDYSIIEDLAQSYDKFGHTVVNQLSEALIVGSLQVASYAMAAFMVIFFLFSLLMKRRAKQMQKVRTAQMKAQLFTDGELAEEIMSGKE